MYEYIYLVIIYLGLGFVGSFMYVETRIIDPIKAKEKITKTQYKKRIVKAFALIIAWAPMLAAEFLGPFLEELVKNYKELED